ncbi:MAG: PP2C family protein-serine/threonine phosphatase [Eubacteriales bacterium]|nr:PP2C family protein-serine/threonine phosphatase [Eubacteriales bacterium]MDD3200316.1 PP2C family protein-serine/threonine phosphatase [Eubacteriales bacterium]MDD4629957.1 PP2C family protein-serine/threonine phosphatase [Eubacteriales bacterium]
MTIRKDPILMREIIEAMDYMVRVMDVNHKVIYMNKRMKEEFGETMGHACYFLLGKNEQCAHCITKETEKTGTTQTKDVLINDKIFNVISSPVSTESGYNYSIEMIHDITEQKKMEGELLKHYAKLKADIDFAKHIQNRALPLDGTYWDSIEINSIYRPSEDLGGDLYDIIDINPSESLLYIADVSGHGITSSLRTIFLRQMMRLQAGEGKADLNEIVAMMHKNYQEMIADREEYLTILLCLYNKENKEVSFLNAGHNCLPVLIKSNGDIQEIPVSGMPICCLMEKVEHKQVKVAVKTGDRIILYTDGITEARNKENEYFETNRFLETIKNNISLDGKELANTIINEVESFSDKRVLDDMAIVIAKII